MSVAYVAYPYHNPPATPLFTTLTSANSSPTRHHRESLPSLWPSVTWIHPWSEHLPLRCLQKSFPETVCAKIHWLYKITIASAVQVAGLRRACRWRSWMWLAWAGVLTHDLWLWGQLDTANYSETTLETAYGSEITSQDLVDIPAASMPIVHFLKICNILWHCAVW